MAQTKQWSDATQKARIVARNLKRRNKTAIAYGPAENRVSGWAFHYLKRVTDKSQIRHSNDYDEYVHYTKLVLGVDGKIYIHDEGHYTPRGESQVEFDRIELASPPYLKSLDDWNRNYNMLCRLLDELNRF